MEDFERERLIQQMNMYYSLSEKYRRYADACCFALPLLQSASGGAAFLYIDQTESVCNKVNNGIHPNQDLLNRLCLYRQNLDTDIDSLAATVESIYYDALTKSSSYESSAYAIWNQLQWG